MNDHFDLVDDQIYSDKFLEIADYIYSANPDPTYVNQCLAKFPHLKRFVGQKSGIIFTGTTEIIENMYKTIPGDGRYIVIQRDVDRSYIQAYHKLKPESVRHLFTVNCGILDPNVTAIPIGVSTTSGYNFELKEASLKPKRKALTNTFVRFNTNPETQERTALIKLLKNNSYCKVVTEQMTRDEFYANIKAHEFTYSLRGNGVDCLRTWEALTLGSIPIVSDTIEMRHFEDMPILFHEDTYNIEKGKSIKRAHMSYWTDKINKSRSWII